MQANKSEIKPLPQDILDCVREMDENNEKYTRPVWLYDNFPEAEAVTKKVREWKKSKTLQGVQ